MSLRSILILSSHLRQGFPSVISLQFSAPKPFMFLLPPMRATSIAHIIYPPRFDHHNKRRGVKIIKPFTVWFSPASYYFLLLRSTYSPHRLVVIIQNKKYNYSFVYFNLKRFWKAVGRLR